MLMFSRCALLSSLLAVRLFSSLLWAGEVYLRSVWIPVKSIHHGLGVFLVFLLNVGESPTDCFITSPKVIFRLNLPVSDPFRLALLFPDCRTGLKFYCELPKFCTGPMFSLWVGAGAAYCFGVSKFPLPDIPLCSGIRTRCPLPFSNEFGLGMYIRLFPTGIMLFTI